MNDPTDLLGELEEVISNGTMKRRIAALNHVTAMFIAAPPTAPREWVASIDEVFVRLVADIEEAARRILAERLSDLPHAPAKIVRTLAFDQSIDVARPILSKSEALDESSIVEIVRTRNQEYLLAVSSRKTLGPAVTDALLSRGDREVIHSTARNNGARFSDDGYRRLVDKVASDDDLAQVVGVRPDLPRHLFLEVLARASETVRKKLEAIRPDNGEEIAQVITTVTEGIKSNATESSEQAVARIERLKSDGQLNEEKLASLATSGNRADAMAILAEMANVPLEVVEHAMGHEREEMILLIAKTIELSRYTVKAILLLREDSEGISAVTLQQQLRSYERLKAPTAQQAVRFYLLQSSRASA